MNGFDAIVIGAGINGLVAAAELSGAGWKVALVDEHDRLGGFIRSDRLTLEGHLHDTFSSWHPLFHISPAFGALMPELARHGLEYCNTDGVLTGAVAADGRAVVVHRDPAKTAAGLPREQDGQAYLAALDRMGADIDAIGTLLGIELRSPAALGPVSKLLRRGGRARLEAWGRDTVMSGRNWSARHFIGPEVDQMWAAWLLHAGLSPDSASGGLMMPLFAATMHGAGLPVVRGGAGRFIEAFAGLLRERGVEFVLGQRVDEIVLEGGRAAGVRVGAERLRASTVLASVTPDVLWNQLLTRGGLADQRQEAREYRFGRAAMQIHVALDKPLQWSATELAGAPLVHLSDGSGSTGIACAEASAGLLPRRPTVAVGQQFLMDPSRVPAGQGQLWLQLQEVPYAPVGDAAGRLDVGGGWTDELVEGYVDRVLDLVEEAAPGTRASVRQVKAFSPVDLEAYNANAHRGDPYSGSAELDQNLVWRPGPATSRHRTAVDGVWHIGASTHPGPGLGGGSGHLVAQALIERARPRSERIRGMLPRKG